MRNTKTVSRRELHYDSLNQLLEDVDRLAEAGASTTGNWSMAQIFDHLAILLDRSVDGFEFQAAWPIRFMVGRLLKKRFLHQPMPAGFRLPSRARVLLASDNQETTSAVKHIHDAVGRFLAAIECHPHPVLGALTHAEWNLLHCRHSELHMSFIAEP